AASAKAMVTSLAECLRYSLVTKNGGSVPLSIELDAVRQYLSLEQELGGGRLNVVFDLDETIQSKMLPAYSILTPVEYMLRSLALADDDGGAVTMEVRSRCRENELEISLSRLGSGLRSTIEPSFDERLREMQARFAESSTGGGRMELVHEHGEQRIAVNVIFSDQDTYGTKITNDHH
ncbi:MAG TPA: histidine kinase, partial [Bacteroidota bacterium]|nr:histidine kinase [Bacteroidota bacterium]